MISDANSRINEDALKAGLATPATCANSAGNSGASPRRNITAGSGRGICACSIFGKSCVWISRSCFGSANPSILACGKKGRYAEHDQSCRQPRFISHEETIHARIGHVNRDLAQPVDCHGQDGLIMVIFQSGTQPDATKLTGRNIRNFLACGDIERVLDLPVTQDFTYLL